jgi:hypothetical protein
MESRELLEAFDRYLADRRLRLDAVVIGPAHVRATLADLGRRLGHGI